MKALSPLEELEGQLVERRGNVWPSEGRRLLGIARGNEKLLVLAMQLGVSEQYMGELLRGEKRPSLDVAARIFFSFKIPAHLWAMKPMASRESLSVDSDSSESAA